MAGNNSNNVTDNRERDIGLSFLGMPTLDDNQELVRSDVHHAVDQLLQTDGIEQQKKVALFTLSLKEVVDCQSQQLILSFKVFIRCRGIPNREFGGAV